jgi:hypothetical protein
MWLSSEASTITVTSATLIVWGAREHKAKRGPKGGTPAAPGPRCFHRASPPRRQPRRSLPVRSAGLLADELGVGPDELRELLRRGSRQQTD